MANYTTLKSDIAAVVKTNGEQEITGANMQSVLFGMIDNSVGTGYLYKGIATPSTSAGTPDQNVFYIAATGTYTNFGGSHVVPGGSIGIFSYNGSWTFETIAFDSAIQQHLHEIDVELNGGVIPYMLYDGYINSSGNWQVSSTNQYKFYVVNVSEGDEVVINTGITSDFAFLSSFTGVVPLQSANRIGDYYHVTPTGTTLTCPTGGTKFMFYAVYNNSNRLPNSIKINGTEVYFDASGGINAKVQEIETIAEEVGDVRAHTNDVSFTLANGGVRNSATGTTIDVSTSTAYKYAVVSCSEGEMYYVTTAMSTSANYPFYAVTADVNDVVTGLFGATQETAGTRTFKVIVPANSTSLYVTAYGDGSTTRVQKFVSYYDLQSQINDISDLSVMLYGYPQLDIARPVILGHNKTAKYLNFAFITDTHYRNDSLYQRISINNMKLFRDFGKERIMDFCAHGGDIITSYGLTSAQAETWIDDTMKILGDIPVPLYVSKGNHDFAGREDGETGDDYISETQSFMLLNTDRNVVLDSNAPFDNYFYKDFDLEKIRVIVLNQYIVVNDTLSSSNLGRELQWLSQDALLTLPPEFKVVIIGHSSLTDFTHFNAIVSAFNGATSVTGTVGDYAYDADFTDLGVKRLTAYIHGHSHQDTFVNTNGYLDIGVINGFSDAIYIDTEKEYKFSVFTFDTTNSVLYETRVGRQWNDPNAPTRNVDRSFSWDTLQELT